MVEENKSTKGSGVAAQKPSKEGQKKSPEGEGSTPKKGTENKNAKERKRGGNGDKSGSSLTRYVDIERGDSIPLEKSNKRVYFVGFMFLTLIVFSASVTLYFRSQMPEGSQEEVAVEVEVNDTAEEEIVVKDEVIQFERNEISLEILNGSGVSGLAGSTADTFEKLGYEIFGTGNAESTPSSQFYLNSEVDGLVEVLLEDVESELDISSISGELTDSSASARIILGK